MTDRDAATLTKTPPTTIDAHLEAHFAASAELTGADKLGTACWTAKLDMLNKLKEIHAAAAWLANDLQELVERIDREGAEATVHSTGVTGDLADKINLGGAELAGLKARNPFGVD